MFTSIVKGFTKQERNIEQEIQSAMEKLADMRAEFAPILEAAKPLQAQLTALEKEIRSLVVEYGQSVAHAGISAGYRRAGKPAVKWNTDGLLALANDTPAILTQMTETPRKPACSISK